MDTKRNPVLDFTAKGLLALLIACTFSLHACSKAPFSQAPSSAPAGSTKTSFTYSQTSNDDQRIFIVEPAGGSVTSSASSNIAENLSEEDLTEILKTLTHTRLEGILTSETDEPDLYIISLSALPAEKNQAFTQWLQSEYDGKGQDHVIVVAGQNISINEDTVEEITGQRFYGWMRFGVVPLECRPDKVIFEIGVSFYPPALMGDGWAYVMEKTADSQWEITDDYMTWIS